MGLGKELSKAVVSAADGLRPDPLGSSGAQIVLQSCPPPIPPKITGRPFQLRHFVRMALEGGGGLLYLSN